MCVRAAQCLFALVLDERPLLFDLVSWQRSHFSPSTLHCGFVRLRQKKEMLAKVVGSDDVVSEAELEMIDFFSSLLEEEVSPSTCPADRLTKRLYMCHSTDKNKQI